MQIRKKKWNKKHKWLNKNNKNIKRQKYHLANKFKQTIPLHDVRFTKLR